MLNSALANYIVTNYVALHPAPHILRYIRIQKYQQSDAMHRRLAHLSSQCHVAVADGDLSTVEELETEVNKVAAKVWHVTSEELKAIQESFVESVHAGQGGSPIRNNGEEGSEG